MVKLTKQIKQVISENPSSVDLEEYLIEGSKLMNKSGDCRERNIPSELNDYLKKIYDRLHYAYDWILQFRKLFNPGKRCTFYELRNLYEAGKSLDLSLLDFTYCSVMFERCRDNKKKLEQLY